MSIRTLWDKWFNFNRHQWEPIYPCSRNKWCDLWDGHEGPCIEEGVRVPPDEGWE